MPRTRIVPALLSAFIGLALASGCPHFDVEEMSSPETVEQRPPVLVVFVTGFGDKPEDLREHRVFEILEHCVGPIHAVVIHRDAIDFLTDSFSSELHRRVTTNRRYRGYEKRVLIGFSSGGTAALEYTTRHPEAFDALVLYAPYLGPDFVIEKIDAAGGLAHWAPEGPPERPEALWMWLKDYGEGKTSRPPTYLLWGRHDAVAPGLSLLLGHLPDRLIVGEEGKHGWEAFDQIWPTFVANHTELFMKGRPPGQCREPASGAGGPAPASG